MRSVIDLPRAGLAAAASLVLAACTPLETRPPAEPKPEPVIREVKVPVEVIVKVPEVSPEDRAARDFLAYFDRVRLMPPAELGREFNRTDLLGNPQAVLEFALALGQTRNPQDTVRALGVLDPLLRSTDPKVAPWQPLARLLAARYGEQRRLEDHIDRQNQQLRESQRRGELATQQLEALKAIERSLTLRRPGSSAAAAAGAASAPASSAAPAAASAASGRAP